MDIRNSKFLSEKKSLLLGGGLALLLLVSALVYRGYANQNDNENAVVESSPTPAATEQGAEVQPLPTPTPSPSETSTATPTASPSATTQVSLPAEVSTVIGGFYDAYGKKNLTQLRTYFAGDTDEILKDQNSTLFTGYDLKGRPGGPILFSDANWSEVVINHVITQAAEQSGSWVVKVDEQRKNGATNTTISAKTIVTLGKDADSSKYLITSYTHAASSGKYNGFFSE